jgi:cytochrome d ubiquinol oxidase subunit I
MNSVFNDPGFWHRLQFGFTLVYHYLFPQLTMGLAWFLVYWKWRALRTGDEKYNRAVRFWAKIFGLNFAVGVVTGIPMEFQFGTNWADFSKYAGGVVGQTLAMEGMFAFFSRAPSSIWATWVACGHFTAPFGGRAGVGSPAIHSSESVHAEFGYLIELNCSLGLPAKVPILCQPWRGSSSSGNQRLQSSEALRLFAAIGAFMPLQFRGAAPALSACGNPCFLIASCYCFFQLAISKQHGAIVNQSRFAAMEDSGGQL